MDSVTSRSAYETNFNFLQFQVCKKELSAYVHPFGSLGRLRPVYKAGDEGGAGQLRRDDPVGGPGTDGSNILFRSPARRRSTSSAPAPAGI